MVINEGGGPLAKALAGNNQRGRKGGMSCARRRRERLGWKLQGKEREFSKQFYIFRFAIY